MAQPSQQLECPHQHSARARARPARLTAGLLLLQLVLPMCALLLVAQLPCSSAAVAAAATPATLSQRLQSLGRRLRHGIERKDQCVSECCSPNGAVDEGHCDSDKTFCVDNQCVACVADSTADSTCMRMTQGRRPRCLANQCIEHPNNGNGGNNGGGNGNVPL